MSDYWERLKIHPGVPLASLFTGLGVWLAVTDGIWLAIPAMSIWWVPVLITARTQPLPEPPEELEGE